MADFREVADESELPPGQSLLVRLGRVAIAIFNAGGNLVALDSACLHCGCDIASGRVAASEVTCPGCGWRYDLVSGCNIGVPKLRIDRFEVKRSGSKILIANHFATGMNGA
jgi:nitrite reductase/ring-hydroxylating ferredoxin subunit